MMIDGQNAAGYYQSLTAEREPFLRRARDVSTLTLPTLVPPEGHSNQTLPTPYQGLGARGVNSLRSSPQTRVSSDYVCPQRHCPG